MGDNCLGGTIVLAKTQEILSCLSDVEQRDLFVEMTARAFRGIEEERALTDAEGQLLGFFLPPPLRDEYIVFLARAMPERVPDMDLSVSDITGSELIAQLEAKYPSTDDSGSQQIAAKTMPAAAR
jgi:hypothetical protein